MKLPAVERLIAKCRTMKSLSTLGAGYFEKMLGHDKVIGYEQGHPVHSMVLPAYGSPGQLNSLLHQFIAMTARMPMLQVASLALNDVCDSDCRGCYFKSLKQSGGAVLTTPEIGRVLDELAAMGVYVITLVGGEPLLHTDIVDIVAGFRPDRASLLLFTNGSRLEPLAPALKKAGLNRVYASLEYADAARHDDYCRHPGLYEKALRGIAAAKKAGMLTGFSWTLHGDARPADLQEVIRLCRATGVNELYICREIQPGAHSCGFTLDDPFYREVAAANRDRGNRFGIVYYHYIMSRFGFGGCPAGGTRMYISPYGDVTPCDLIAKSFGNVRTAPLSQIWDGMAQHPCLGTISGPCRAGLQL